MISKPTKIERTKTVRLATRTKDLEERTVSGCLVSDVAFVFSDGMSLPALPAALNLIFGEGAPKALSKVLGSRTKESNNATRSEAEKGLIVPNSFGDFDKNNTQRCFVLELNKPLHSRTRRYPPDDSSGRYKHWDFVIVAFRSAKVCRGHVLLRSKRRQISFCLELESPYPALTSSCLPR